MSNTLFLVLLTLVGGVAVTLQSQMMGVVDRNVGTLPSVLFTYGSGAILVGLIYLVARPGSLGEVASQPAFTWFSGVMGLIIIGTIGYTVPRLGLGAALTLFVAFQLIAAVVIDHFGWLGAAQSSVSVTKIIGILVLMFGTWLVVKQ